MRGRLFNFPVVPRAVGFALVATAIVVTMIHLDRHETAPRPSPKVFAPQTDLFAQEITRCDALGRAAEQDAKCEAAWAENRRHFFTYSPGDNGSRTTQTRNQAASQPEGR